MLALLLLGGSAMAEDHPTHAAHEVRSAPALASGAPASASGAPSHVSGASAPGSGATSPASSAPSLAPGERSAWEQLRLEGHVFGGFGYVHQDRFSEFDLGRAELSAGWSPAPGFGMELTTEAIRSVGPQAVLGVDGNSLVLRVKRAWAWGGADLGPVGVQGRAGLIPDPWIAALEAGYDLRAARPLLAERGRFHDASDLGAGLRLRALDETLTLQVAVLNGEGRNDIERNSGKNVAGVLSWTPRVLETREGDGVLGVHIGGRRGSEGAGEARSHRMSAALTFLHPRFNAGGEFVRALGWDGQGDRDAQGMGFWAGGTLRDPWIGLLARVDLLNTDLDVGDAGQLQITAGLYSDVARVRGEDRDGRIRLHALVQRNTAQENASPVPGVAAAVEDTRVLLLMEARGRQGFALR